MVLDIHPVTCSVILYRQHALDFPMACPPPGGPGCIHGHLWKVESPHQRQQDDRDGLLDPSNRQQEIRGGLPEAGDGGGNLLPGEAVAAGKVPGVIGRFDSRVAGGTPPVSAWDDPCT